MTDTYDTAHNSRYEKTDEEWFTSIEQLVTRQQQLAKQSLELLAPQLERLINLEVDDN